MFTPIAGRITDTGVLITSIPIAGAKLVQVQLTNGINGYLMAECKMMGLGLDQVQPVFPTSIWITHSAAIERDQSIEFVVKTDHGVFDVILDLNFDTIEVYRAY